MNDLVEFEDQLRTWLATLTTSSILIRMVSIFPEKALHPKEEVFVANAVANRRSEFSAGRYCARELMSQIGLHSLPILVGSKGEPLWGDLVVGSITHDNSIAIAVVSSDPQVDKLGIDLIELNHQLSTGATQLIVGSLELDCVARIIERYDCFQTEDITVNPLLLAFSAKESAIKAISPLLDYYIDFREMTIGSQGRVIKVNYSKENIMLDVHWYKYKEMIFTIALPYV